MYYCEKCKVKVAGNFEHCPLCSGCLTGDVSKEELFPDIPPEKPRRLLLFKILILCSAIAVSVCFAVNASIAGQSWWLNYVLAGLASFWLVFGIAAKKRENPVKAVLWLSIMASLLVLLWDAATGFHHWSVDFVLPVLYVCAIAATIILALFLCLKPQDYIFYLVLNICFGMIPLILYLFNVLNVVCPSAICAAVSIITMSALIIFKGNALKEELDRRLHI